MSSSKDFSALVPESYLIPSPEPPQLRKRLIGEMNDPKLVSKGKRKASPERCNARRPKMSRTLERVQRSSSSLALFLPLRGMPRRRLRRMFKGHRCRSL
ncbi:hypothetical protein ACOSP7_005276 [Xanthoceras sorbifolium]